MIAEVDYQPIVNLLVRALSSSNDGETTAAITLARRKMDKVGFDIHNLGVYDTNRAIGGGSVGPAQIIRSKNLTIENLTRELDEMKARLVAVEQKLGARKNGAKVSMASSKTRNDQFAWENYPIEEADICLAFIKGERQSAAKTASDLTARLRERGIHIYISEGIIKQRLNNNPPPRSVTDLIGSGGQPSWPELWYLGAKIAMKPNSRSDGARAWKKEVFATLGRSNRDVGADLSDITPEMMRDLRAHVATIEKRKKSRSNGETKKFIIKSIRDAGPGGITRKEVQNLDPDNTNITKRFTEILDTGLAIELNGRLIHHDFKDSYPVEWAVMEKARMEKLTK